MRRPGSWPRWTMWVLLGVVALALVAAQLLARRAGEKLTYTEFMAQVEQGNVESVVINNSNGTITGKFDDGTEFTTTGGGDRGVVRGRRGAAQGATASSTSSRRPATTGCSASPGCCCRCC